jgi:hypothetical protein
VALQPKSGLGRHFLRFLDHTQLDTHTCVRISGQLVAEDAIYTTHNKHKILTPIISAGFEPWTLGIQRKQTCVLDCTATGVELIKLKIWYCIRITGYWDRELTCEIHSIH